MKHLKNFTESIEDVHPEKMFWIINLKQPHLKIAFKHIGMNDDTVEEYFKMFKIPYEEIVLIFKNESKNSNDYWSYCGINSTNWEGIKHIDNPEYKNMGEVYITDEQADAEKYNL